MSLIQPFRHALPVNGALFHQPLYLTHAGWERIKPGAAYPQTDASIYFFNWQDGRTLPEFCLTLMLAGTGEFQTRTHGGRLRAGDALLFRPGEWHRHRPRPQTGWTLMWIHFNGDEPLRWLREHAFHLRNNRLIVENRPLFRAQFEHLLASVHCNPSVNLAGFARQTLGLLAHVLMEKSDEAVLGAEAVRDEVVKTAVEFIWNFSHAIVDVPAVARRAGIARRTLDRRFKVATGRTVLEEIQACRLSRAAKLLQETTMPVKHIVHRAGFRSDEHLRLAFQKQFKKSPMAYRQDGG